MPRFVLLDHSLKGVGGHHFDYALHVLHAADDLGYEPVLVSNKRFRGNAKLPPACRVMPLFRYHTYSKYTIFAGTRHKFAGSGGEGQTHEPKSLWTRLRELPRNAKNWLNELRHKSGPQRRIRDFSGACRKAYSRLGLQAGDVVFVPTLSELDLAGLATFLESEPASREVDWHVQFHFNIFDGREPDYPQQVEKFTRLREHFADTLARVDGHRLYFYNTSDILTRQYNRLEMARFEELPYPINEAFHTRRIEQRDSSRPLRITCAGGVRAEKGQQGLGNLVNDLWKGCLDEGRAQLLVQAKPGRFTGKPRFQIPLPNSTQEPRRTYLPTEECDDPVVYIRHPLAIDDYEELVRRADIGLLLYDSARYYSRRAGVLGEMLAAGIPVVVPAGCWLAEQIAEPNYRHAARMAAQLPCLGRSKASELSWQGVEENDLRLRSGNVLAIEGPAEISCQCAVPGEASELALSFGWLQPSDYGTYLKVVLEQFDESGVSLDRSTSILGRRELSRHQLTLLRTASGAKTVRLALSNAYDTGELSVRDLEMRFLSSAARHEQCSPLGAVGMVAADPSEAPRLLREIISHYEHYRQTAGAFSVEWFRRHDPRLTVQTLLDKSACAQPQRDKPRLRAAA